MLFTLVTPPNKAAPAPVARPPAAVDENPSGPAAAAPEPVAETNPKTSAFRGLKPLTSKPGTPTLCSGKRNVGHGTTLGLEAAAASASAAAAVAAARVAARAEFPPPADEDEDAGAAAAAARRGALSCGGEHQFTNLAIQLAGY